MESPISTADCRVFINDRPADNVRRIDIILDADQPLIICNVVCLDINNYTEHRAQGYIERIYDKEFWIVLSDVCPDEYFIERYIND